KTTLAPNHPYKRFAVGNLETLVDKEGKTLRSALLDFYDVQYSANRMKLTVLGKEDLSTLAKWVETRFSDIPNKNLPVKTITEPFFAGGFLPAKLQVESVMDSRSLSLSFPIPSTKNHIHSQPMGYIANLIGHEGKGSLLSALKDKQLVDTLSAGTQFDTGAHAMFIITMSLTESGLKKQDEIMGMVFSYIELLNQKGITKLYFDEQAKLSDIGFKFKEKSPALSYVRSLSATLHDFKPHEVLSAFYQLNDFKPELIEDYLSYLKPDNVLVSVKAQGLKTDKETTWFKAPYSVAPLSISLTNQLRKASPLEALALPEPNAFIPDNTDL
ncbi:insulinase family protein, partial [Oleiphilus sp. HI0079]|uniref:insulinase family protein n=2 Tax=Oleiphilus TaxID=141450 RepID=UPI000AAE2857